MSTAASFVFSNFKKYIKCLSIEKWLNKLWPIDGLTEWSRLTCTKSINSREHIKEIKTHFCG